MEINKQLFEDVLSGKLKGTFILRNGNKISGNKLYYSDSGIAVIKDFIYKFKKCDIVCNIKYNCRGNATGFSNSYDIIDFIPDTDMKENELTIKIPQGKEIDWDESKKENKIVLKDKQLTYEDICEKLFKDKDIFYIKADGCIESTPYFNIKSHIYDKTNATTEHQLECILAKNKLATVAKYLNDGWKPAKGSDMYNINNYYGNLVVYLFKEECSMCLGQVIFKTKELALQAIEILGEETIKLALEPLGI